MPCFGIANLRHNGLIRKSSGKVIHMRDHIVEPPETRRRTRPVARPGYETAVVRPVGTFASGQSEEGSFHVAADAGLGSFGEGVADERPAETECPVLRASMPEARPPAAAPAPLRLAPRAAGG